MLSKNIFLGLILIAIVSITATAQDSTYTPEYMIPDGPQLIAVYLGAEDCGPCHTPEVMSAIRNMKTMLKDRAAERGRAFTVTGVALDRDTEVGFNYLQGVGPFDEMIVGKEYSNLGAYEYIWSDTVAYGSGIPQVVLVEREIRTMGSGIVFSPSKIIARYIGPKTIVDWVKAGVPWCWRKAEYGPLSWAAEDCSLK